MSYQVVPFMLLNALVFCLAGVLALYAFLQYVQQTRRPVLLAFGGFMLSICGWQVTEFMAYAATDVETKLLMQNVENAVPAALFLYFLLWFALAYTDNDQWVNPWLPAFAFVNVVGLGLAVSVSPEFLYEPVGLTTQGPVTIFGATFEQWVVLDRQLNPPFRAYQLYAYAIHLLVAGILVRYVLKNQSELYAGQVAALLVGIVPQVVFNSLIFLSLVPPILNITGVLFGLTAIGFGVAVFRYRLLKVAPVGRKQLVDIISEPVVMLDADNQVVDSNLAARRLCGVGSGWQGLPVATFFRRFPEVAERVTNPDGSETELSVSVEGTIREYDLETSPIRGSGDTEWGRVLWFRNVTEQRERERRLETQKKLIQRRNEELETLNRILRHDIRNDVVVMSRLGAQLEAHVDDDGEELLHKLLDRSDHIKDLTTGLRDLMRTLLDEDRELRPVQIDAVLESEVRDVSQSYDDATVTRGEFPRVTVEANQMLSSVFRNILENAIKHNDSEVPEVDVSVQERNDWVQIRISDNGPGVPEDIRQDIFGKGEKGLESKGTGIGLYLVNQLVEQYGGEVWVEDREGQSPSGNRTKSGDRAEHGSAGNRSEADDSDPRGATFVVELPKAETERAEWLDE